MKVWIRSLSHPNLLIMKTIDRSQSCEKYPKVILAKMTNNTILNRLKGSLQHKKADCRLTLTGKQGSAENEDFSYWKCKLKHLT